jgi:FKBP-type peptidyl-prolyl cis-trans isomerase FkpA/FKBP-type peptidyl-prolyl cis-trans isomerase FklB
MRKTLVRSLVVVLASASVAGAAGPPATEQDKTMYALGLALARSLSSFALTAAELEQVAAGLSDGVLGREPKVDLQTYGPKLQQLQQARAAATAEGERKAGQAFLSKAGAEKGATKTASGVVVTPLKPGTGPSPTANDKVKVHYHGTLIDGTVFDSSVERKEPATFPLGGVIKCWTEGLQTMKVGGRSRLVCPPDAAYGDRGAPPRIKPGATLVFEVELLEIVK